VIACPARPRRDRWRSPGLQASPGDLPTPFRLARAIPLLLLAAALAAALQLASVLAARLSPAPEPEPIHEDPSSLRVFTPQVRRWSSEIQAWSTQYDLPAPLIAAVMQIESCGDPTARSGAGAQGLFQVMPFHFAPGEAPLDPETNARRALTYLSHALELSGGRVDLALAGYNGGHSRITQSSELWPDETRRYVAWGAAIYADAASGQGESPALKEWLRAGGARLCQSASDGSA
jgi:soluble lytic murein transglycosylase-like protein